MRDHLFRAWHEDAETMMFDQKPGDCLRWKHEGQPVVVMKWTGIKDSNGVEVYEGDLLYSADCVYGVVVYDEGLSAYSVEYPKFAQLLMDYRLESEGRFTVAGSRYTHPHLLKGEEA